MSRSAWVLATVVLAALCLHTVSATDTLQFSIHKGKHKGPCGDLEQACCKGKQKNELVCKAPGTQCISLHAQSPRCIYCGLEHQPCCNKGTCHAGAGLECVEHDVPRCLQLCGKHGQRPCDHEGCAVGHVLHNDTNTCRWATVKVPQVKEGEQLTPGTKEHAELQALSITLQHGRLGKPCRSPGMAHDLPECDYPHKCIHGTCGHAYHSRFGRSEYSRSDEL